jgi:hypothetical protein
MYDAPWRLSICGCREGLEIAVRLKNTIEKGGWPILRGVCEGWGFSAPQFGLASYVGSFIVGGASGPAFSEGLRFWMPDP